MKAGEELNNLIAEKVMGWPPPIYITDECHDPKRPIYGWHECHRPHLEGLGCEHSWQCGSHKYYPAPDYSGEIAAAWEVAVRLRAFRIHHAASEPEYVGGLQWIAVCEDAQGRTCGGLGDGSADTAALAICLAAWEAFGVDIPS